MFVGEPEEDYGIPEPNGLGTNELALDFEVFGVECRNVEAERLLPQTNFGRRSVLSGDGYPMRPEIAAAGLAGFSKGRERCDVCGLR